LVEDKRDEQADRSIGVVAEWALEVRDLHDVSYRLQDCSKGSLSGRNFMHILERYSPGTIEKFPQVTVSWFADRATGRNYVGLAIYRQSGPEAAQSESTVLAQTSYFSVPFSQLATNAISYSSMYERFRHLVLPSDDSSLISTRLTVARPPVPRASLVALAAALLLTDIPVCILGADQVDLGERLTFIDQVASLLPYGIRSRLSAATWTRSTYKTHRIRLFFSSSDRNVSDHLLTWGKNYKFPYGLEIVDQYVAWLRTDTSRRVGQLCDERKQMGFGWDQVGPMLRRLGVVSDHGGPGLEAAREPGERAATRPVSGGDDGSVALG
jgi:hypothetical protein